MQTMPAQRRLAPWLAAAALAAGCASAPPPAAVPGRLQPGLQIGDAELPAEWSLPPGRPSALLVLQHGFARQCRHLRGTARQIADGGLLVLCIDAEMARGNPALADRLALALLDGAVAGPDGQPLPLRIAVGGHSAGALFAARLGQRLAALAPARLAGALLLDPVAADGFADALAAIAAAGRPVLAVTANPGGCNAQGNALAALPAGALAVQLLDRSTHLDAEGSDTSWLAVAACGQPLPANVALLRTLAAAWAGDMAAGARTPAFYPGGAWLEPVLASGAARLR